MKKVLIALKITKNLNVKGGKLWNIQNQESCQILIYMDGLFQIVLVRLLAMGLCADLNTKKKFTLVRNQGHTWKNVIL